MVIVPKGVWYRCESATGVTLMSIAPPPTDHPPVDVADPRRPVHSYSLLGACHSSGASCHRFDDFMSATGVAPSQQRLANGRMRLAFAPMAATLAS